MEYNKPEVSVLGSAVNVIESSGKDDVYVDAPLYASPSAYQADE